MGWPLVRGCVPADWALDWSPFDPILQSPCCHGIYLLCGPSPTPSYVLDECSTVTQPSLCAEFVIGRRAVVHRRPSSTKGTALDTPAGLFKRKKRINGCLIALATPLFFLQFLFLFGIHTAPCWSAAAFTLVLWFLRQTLLPCFTSLLRLHCHQ
ncbi:hypothetical protein B0T17DRAFT_299219 [Bombardia bombarda]|uniref:Uncharacterized protein n=1 Tax=Bombardia bombarda TaxID=252184 RepID=A0AA39WU47_9PEZI|nr:hypothetical protein B0T17DRAFT_299219 [Bombardia bombarda]